MKKEMKFPENPPSAELFKIKLNPKMNKETEPQTVATIEMETEQLIRGIRRSASDLSEDTTNKWRKKLDGDYDWDKESNLGSMVFVDSQEGIAQAMALPQKPPIVQRRISDLEQKSKKTEAKTNKDPRLVSKKIFDAKQIGIKMYTTEKHPFPPEQTRAEIMEKIDRRMYKWDFDSDIQENIIQKAMQQGQIQITGECLMTISQRQFDKVKNGRQRKDSYEKSEKATQHQHGQTTKKN